MTEQPSAYDIIQDHRLDALDELVHPYYQPPSEVEHSFPVVGQGVSADMYQQMSLAQGDGILITDGSESPYILTGMPGGNSETNATNRMILKVATNTGRAEAVIGGFYHVLYQDMQIDLPPVSTGTTYIIALTYDPRREEEENGPIRVEVHTNVLPRTHGRKHIVLHTVQRQPNQLLTDATRQMHRQYIAPTIVVNRGEAGLPDSADVLYGTLGVTRNTGGSGEIYAGTGSIYESRGTYGWQNLFVGEWVDLQKFGGWEYENCLVRHRSGGLDIRGHFKRVEGHTGNRSRLARLPDGFTFTTNYYHPIVTSRHGNTRSLHIDPATGDLNIFGGDIEGGWVHVSVFVPDYYLAN